ncbi:DUF2341 domain-containing protein [Paenibacillus chungangensis]|uniref:DUF2341 domain-containing protein n=1 Tax=Paenibacillus chungangensis TaxID=696535 RepID=A0ABW3HVB0_9BACL
MRNRNWKKVLCAWLVMVLTVGVLPFGAAPLSVAASSDANEVSSLSEQDQQILFHDDGTSLQEAGWILNAPPVEGVYITDSTASLGNPNGVDLKQVEEGHYLLYGNKTASDTVKYSTMTKSVPIGSGAWTVAFKARFVDLMKPSQHPAYRGVSFEVFAGGQEYKITFNDQNKILAMTNPGGAYVQEEVIMPADDAFHQWELSYDGSRNVSVKLDGEVVASFQDIAIPVSGREDAIVILNAPLNWEAGRNEVYIDDLTVLKGNTDLLFMDDASSLQESGWNRSSNPLSGVYITDADNTLGNPNNAEMKSVEAGQYLFYGDERASQDRAYTSLMRQMPIGAGAWVLEFSARFVDLMKPSAYYAERGLSFDIHADGKRYKLTFNDDNKIWALSGNQQQAIAMPEDDAFHNWKIMYNGHDTIYVQLDDATVARFDNASVATTQSDRLSIVNAPLDWEAGTTEVYIDSMKLYKTPSGDPYTLIADDASSLEIADWTVTPPTETAYFRDHAGTGGTADGMLPVEEGMYFTFANTASSTPAAISMEKAIGDGPWALEIEARMEELVQSAASGPEQGLTLELAAGGTLYRIIFNNGNQLWVGNSDGGYERIEAELLSEAFFDQWGIAYDEHGRLMITQNGIKLGLLENAGVPTDAPDHLSIINNAVGAWSGETRVFFEQISLLKEELPEWSQFQPVIAGVTVLPTSQSDHLETIVSVYDADPLRFQDGGNPLLLEAELYKGEAGEGGLLSEWAQPATGASSKLTLQAGGETGRMLLKLRLVDGAKVVSQTDHNVEVYSKVNKLVPKKKATAGPGEMYLFTAMEQAEAGHKQTAAEAGWNTAGYTYEGTDSGGVYLENTDEALELKLPVKLKGWFGVVIGYVTGTEGFIVSDSKDGQVHTIVMDGDMIAEASETYGDKAMNEVFAFASKFRNGTVRISPMDGKKARIAYVKLKGLSDEEIELYQKQDEGPNGKRVIYNNDGYSDFFSGMYDTKEGLYEHAVDLFENQDVSALHWALGTTMNVLRDSAAAGMPYAGMTPEQEALMRDGDKHVRDTVLTYIDAGNDPLTLVASRGKEIGLETIASLRMSAFYNEAQYPWLNGNRYGEFTDKGYRQVRKDGSQAVQMSYAFPEYRQYIIDVLKEAATVSDTEGNALVAGVELDYCRYPYVLGYEAILTDAYEAEYGVDPRNETSAEGLQRWQQFRADIMTAFMQEVRDELEGKSIAVRIPNVDYFQYGLDIDAWIEQELVDMLVPCTIGHEDFFEEIGQFHELTDDTGIKLYGNINGTLSGHDLTKREEELLKRGVRLKVGHTRVSRAQYLLRAHQYYEAGYDGIYIFNSWRGIASEGQSTLGLLGDKVKVEKWYGLSYPAEWVQNLVTVEPPGSLVVPGTDVLAASIGFTLSDHNPSTGALSDFGATYGFALDYDYRSVGADLGEEQSFNSIELSGTQPLSRVEKPDLSLYVSNDNATYTKVQDWDFLKLGERIILYNFSETARYVKVHNHFDDPGFTYQNANLQQMMKVFNRPAGSWTASGGGDWSYSKQIQVANSGNGILYDRAVYVTKQSLDTAGLIAAGKLQSDYRDVRFADDNGRELHFYMDDDGFFVRIPELAAADDATIWMYYGNPAASFRGAAQEALQVEYGNKTLQQHDSQGELGFGANVKPIRLQDGTLALVAQTTKTEGIHAQYSFDNGRTWSAPEPFISPGSRAGVSLDSPGGAYVDPATGTVYVMFYSYHYFNVWNNGAADCLDASQCRTDLYFVKSTGFQQGKPVFGQPVQVTGMTTAGGDPVHYALTYANPIRTDSGRLVAPISYVIGADGTFGGGVVYSDDDGSTWTKSVNDLSIPAVGGEGGISESAVVELADGSLKMYLRQQRSDKFSFASSVSTDEGVNWTPVADSEVMSTNTMPALSRMDNGDILLNWSGHNAMNSGSYYRNDLTAAYSSDEAGSWNGYRDLLGRTRLSAPGWYAFEQSRRVTEADHVPAGSGDYLFAWSGEGAHSMLIEDFYRYLYRSHGAMDDFEYENNGLTENDGSRLANDYWWQTTKFGTLESSANRAKQGQRSLRLHDHEETKRVTAGSRMFPAMREGSVSLWLNGASFDSDVHISLQEGYSTHWNAVGTAFMLQIDENGTVRYSDASQPYVDVVAGYIADDLSPATSNLTHLGYSGGFALDYKDRSIGVDLGRVETVLEVKLKDNDGSSRIEAGDLEVYVSDNNDGDWTQASGWTFDKTGGIITLSGMSVQARYVKVHQAYSDTAFSFVGELQDMMEVTTQGNQSGSQFQPLPVPTNVALNEWFKVKIDFDLEAGLADIYVNGDHKGTVAAAHPGEAVKHLMIAAGSGTGTDVYMDELIIQDTSLGKPQVTLVGSECSVLPLEDGWKDRDEAMDEDDSEEDARNEW